MVKTDEEISQEQYERLKWNVNALNELLKNPEFGLATWNCMVGDRLKFIHDYWKNSEGK